MHIIASFMALKGRKLVTLYLYFVLKTEERADSYNENSSSKKQINII